MLQAFQKYATLLISINFERNVFFDIVNLTIWLSVPSNFVVHQQIHWEHCKYEIDGSFHILTWFDLGRSDNIASS